METTIAIKERTAQLLMQLKRKLEAKSFDEIILAMIKEKEKIPSSRFGSQPALKKFTEREKTYREL
ncbi:hypothetical protein J4461_01295 [Candidatus Pacearchaeota archaeon]|nr:hypothetical protein [Candidatus Pacearchaeota archaeon]